MVVIHGAAGSQQGTSLIEVLITVVLVTIGLLGLAGLQLMTVQNTNSATQRFEATVLAQDILERMRANRQQALNGQYDLALNATPTASSLAGDDLQAWISALTALHGGNGSIAVADDGVVTIQVAWNDISNDNAGDSRAMSVFMRTGL